VVVKRLKVTKREAILVSIARIGSAPDPKSMQTNRIKGGVSEWVAGFKSSITPLVFKQIFYIK